MKQYIWFHPTYIAETKKTTLQGQINNAKQHHYIVLSENELGKVHAWDHLTIVGNSKSPKETESLNEDENDGTGLFFQRETGVECVRRLQASGLRVPPKILSLECGYAAVKGGIAQQLSKHPFFSSTLLEANSNGIGRNPGTVVWSGFLKDAFGRTSIAQKEKNWSFMVRGETISTYQHGEYNLKDVLKPLLSSNFHNRFFEVYNPGCNGGRVGRYCRNNRIKITLEKAMQFATSDPDSATGRALESIMREELSLNVPSL
jgi:hypothetical protein